MDLLKNERWCRSCLGSQDLQIKQWPTPDGQPFLSAIMCDDCVKRGKDEQWLTQTMDEIWEQLDAKEAR